MPGVSYIVLSLSKQEIKELDKNLLYHGFHEPFCSCMFCTNGLWFKCVVGFFYNEEN